MLRLVTMSPGASDVVPKEMNRDRWRVTNRLDGVYVPFRRKQIVEVARPEFALFDLDKFCGALIIACAAEPVDPFTLFTCVYTYQSPGEVVMNRSS
jgi:hypothetical protein